MDVLEALSRADRGPPRHDPPRAGRRVHGRRLRPPDGPGRRRDGDPRARRDQPRHRHRRRVPRPRADGRDHRPDRARQAPQGGAPVRRHRPHVRAGDEVEPARRASRRPCPRSCARRSASPSSRSPARPTSSSPRTSRPRPSPTTCARSSRPRPTSRSRPTRPSSTPPGCWPARAGRSSWPATASSARTRRTALRAFAKGLHVPVAATFMGKGAIDDRSHLSLMAVGLQARDHVLSGFDRVGPRACPSATTWSSTPRRAGTRTAASGSSTSTRSRPRSTRTTSPRSSSSATSTGRCAGCSPAVLPLGIGGRGRERAARHARDARPPGPAHGAARRAAAPTSTTTAGRSSRRRRSSTCAARSDRRTSWSATSARTRSGSRGCTRPTSRTRSSSRTASRRWASRCPGAIAAKLVHPERRVVALCGDGGFLMNSQELETARRIGANITVVVWRDDGYGLIDWKQRTEFGHPFGVGFGNPDFVAYAQSFGLAGLPAGLGRRPLPDPDARARARRTVARRGPDRLPRERSADRTPRGDRAGLVAPMTVPVGPSCVAVRRSEPSASSAWGVAWESCRP